MRGWIHMQRPSWRVTFLARSTRRLFSAQNSVHHIRVPCASSGEITVSLNNITQNPQSTDPLVIWIPPFSQHNSSSSNSSHPIPSWLQRYPAAVINYRWVSMDDNPLPSTSPPARELTSAMPTPFHWPTPLADVFFGYSWILDSLSPPDGGHRDIYVVGSYLGASLATSLALTESRTDRPMTVRGLVSYNGIYDWTTFLPGHPIQHAKPPKGKQRFASTLQQNQPENEGGPMFQVLRQLTPDLFDKPANLFDPFASACLFFQSPPLHVPPDFETSMNDVSSSSDSLSAAIGALSLHGGNDYLENDASPIRRQEIPISMKPPRKGYLSFPPRKSTLVIPDTFLLSSSPSRYTATPTPSTADKTSHLFGLGPAGKTIVRRKPPTMKKQKQEKNNFAVQASELAWLMQRSVATMELKERMRLEPEFEDFDARVLEAERRVQLESMALDDTNLDVEGDSYFGLSAQGEGMVVEWLEEKIEEGRKNGTKK
ncbi:hypothetical protein B0H63DRAFT_62097 [Podospora didyma]|uniref:Alpha/beta hydrolase fold-3 domain-containing protein n=1 Tax=Podospora didyma TaxID=330526 RepID=A0AAE0U8Z3_9PEZI|nr:hypothetical protein B0H63DRAFT_62097 [Podospora didyma]